jgi:hypothetical protein
MPGKTNNKNQQTSKNKSDKNAFGKKSGTGQQTANKKAPKKSNTKAESVERNNETDQE